MKFFISFIILIFTVNVSANSNKIEHLRAKRYKCEHENIIELDDGISSAEIIGKAVASKCEKECLDIAEHVAKAKGFSLDNEMKDSTFQRCIDMATSSVLQYRVSEKKRGVIEHINIENWEFIHGKSKFGKFYEIMTFAENAPSAMSIKCLDSTNTTQAASGPQIMLSVSVGKKLPFQRNLTGNKEFLLIRTSFDNKDSSDRTDLLWILREKNMVIKVAQLVYPFIDKLVKTKELKLDLEELGRPIIYDLSGFSDSIDRIAESCKSFNIDRK